MLSEFATAAIFALLTGRCSAKLPPKESAGSCAASKRWRSSMKLYCCQTDITWEDKVANYGRVQKLLGAAKPKRNSLVVLPEMFATGFSMNVPAIQEGPKADTE